MFWFREQVQEVEVAFTDRRGGVSPAPFDALNLSSASGDDPGNVERNHRSLAEALGVGELSLMHQVHGRDVVTVAGGARHGSIPTCDALVSREVDTALLVRVADCVPVVLADPRAGVIGCVHAGRAGLVLDVVGAAVAAMRDDGASDITAWVGPRACPKCYELPEAIVEQVEAAVPGTRSTTSWGTPSVDVGRGVVDQLQGRGVQVRDIGAGVCTIEDEDFFSYRRQGQRSGRFGAVVVRR